MHAIKVINAGRSQKRSHGTYYGVFRHRGCLVLIASRAGSKLRMRHGWGGERGGVAGQCAVRSRIFFLKIRRLRISVREFRRAISVTVGRVVFFFFFFFFETRSLRRHSAERTEPGVPHVPREGKSNAPPFDTVPRYNETIDTKKEGRENHGCARWPVLPDRQRLQKAWASCLAGS
jgi:hypothetical protein